MIMKKEDLCKDLVCFFEENSKKTNLSLETKFKNDLGFDSLDVVELVMKLEEKYDIKIEDEDANKMENINDVACLIMKLKNIE
jgi:acyl carrier protein